MGNCLKGVGLSVDDVALIPGDAPQGDQIGPPPTYQVRANQ